MAKLLKVLIATTLLLASFSVAHSQSVSLKWQYSLQSNVTRMYFGSSPAMKDLGSDVNIVGGEPAQNMEIVTGSDEYSNFFPELGAPAYGLWRCFDSEGNLEWVADTKSDEARTSPLIVDLNSDLNLEIATGTTSGWCVEVMNRFGSWTGGVSDAAWTFPYPPQRSGPFMWHSSPAAANLATGTNLEGLEIVIGNNPRWDVWAFDGDNSDGVNDGMTADLSSWGYPGPVGTEGVDWDVLWVFQTGGIVIATPACGDVDGDGHVEVVVGSNDGKLYCINGATGTIKWSYQTGGGVLGSAALADFDTDGDLEMIAGSTDGHIYCIDGDENDNGIIDLSEVVSFSTGGAVYSSPAIGDVDNDGNYDIVIGSDDTNLYCLRYSPVSGTVVESWHYTTGDIIRSSPAIAASGRPTLTVYAGSSNGNLYILHGNGSLIVSYAVGGPIVTSPSVADVDGDGKLEVALTAYGPPDRVTVLRDDDSNVSPYASEWPQFRHDESRTGLYPWRPPVYEPDVATIKIYSPRGAYLRDAPIVPRALVMNLGQNTESFPVQFMIRDASNTLVYSSTRNVTVASGDSLEVAFDAYANTQAGNFAGRCQTALAGDGNPDNDFKVRNFVVFHPQWVEHFDSSSGGFSQVGGGWEWGVPTSGPGAAYSGDKVWATILAGDYFDGANWRLTSTDYKATQDDPILLFYHWYAIEHAQDGGNVKVSTDGGVSWQLVTPLEGYPGIATWDNAGIPDQPCYTGDSSGWELAVFVLPVGNGQTFKIRWDFGSDNTIVRPGWYLDDEMGIGFYRLNHDVAARAIHGLAGTIVAGTVLQPSVIVENWGGFDETFPVELSISGTAYSETNSVTLAIGAVDSVACGPWTAELGSYIAVAYTALVGDEDPSNDSTSVAFQVVPQIGAGEMIALNDVAQTSGVDELLRVPDPATGVATLIGSLGNNFRESEAMAVLPAGLAQKGGGGGAATASLYDRIFVVDDARLLELDPITGNGTEIGPIGFADVDGIAFEPATGVLYGITWGSNKIISIDIATGQGTLVANHVLEGHRMNDLAFHPTDGRAFILTGNTTPKLHQVNIQTGEKLHRWVLSGATSCESLLWSLDGQTLYTAGDRGDTKDLCTIDLDNSTVSFVSGQSSGFDDIEALAWVNHQTSQVLLTGRTTDVVVGPPVQHRLHQNTPNPFNPSTRIDFELPRAEAVDLSVYDVAGRQLATLVHGVLQGGRHHVVWNGQDRRGERVVSGVYQYALRGRDWSVSRRMVVVK